MICMNIKLVQVTPREDGYYLVKFGEQGGLHLVLIQTELDGQRVILSDVCPFRQWNTKKELKCATKGTALYFKEFPTQAWWSEEPFLV
jgi:hypothetical protein